MRLLLAMMKHETNTFSPIPTDLQRFRDWGLHEGAAHSDELVSPTRLKWLPQRLHLIFASGLSTTSSIRLWQCGQRMRSPSA